MVAYFQFEGVKNNDDLEAIKKTTEELSQAVQKIGEKLYNSAKEAENKYKKQEVRSEKQGDEKPEEEKKE